MKHTSLPAFLNITVRICTPTIPVLGVFYVSTWFKQSPNLKYSLNFYHMTEYIRTGLSESILLKTVPLADINRTSSVSSASYRVSVSR